MVQTVDWLLPCLPAALYAGLTRTAAERLLALRSAAEQVWELLAPAAQAGDFPALFGRALALFDGEPDGVVVSLVQDELLGAMSGHSGIDYNLWHEALADARSKRTALLGPLVEKTLWQPPESAPPHRQ